jgi:hypothetical protein
MTLKEIAKETLQILEKGEFISKHGNVINFAVEQQLAEKSTRLYRPEEVANLLQNMPCHQEQSLLIEVPWFRIRSRELLDDYFLASVITAPAPNAGQVLRRDSNALPAIEKILRQRAGYVLAVAQDNGHRSLLLGAWGCGVFANNAAMVADAFGQWLESPRFQGCFDRVVFGIYDSSKSKNTLNAFENRFG